MKIKILGILALLAFSTSFFYFYKSRQVDLFLPEIVDYPHQSGRNALFETADGYKYAQDYKKAETAFQRLLTQPLSMADSQYVLNQLAYINLTINEDSTAAYWIRVLEKSKAPLSKEALADYNYNIGVWAYHTFKPKMAEAYLQKALQGYRGLYGEQHLRVGLCLTALGMSYYEFEQSSDSSFKYIPLAYEVFQKQPNLRKFSAFCEFSRACYCLSNRTYETGEAHCDNVFNILESTIYQDSLLIARSFSMKGNMLKKKAENESDSILKKTIYKKAEKQFNDAIEIGKKLKSHRLQEFYANTAIYYMHIQDSINTFKNISNIENLVKIQDNRFGNPDRLRGLYFSKKCTSLFTLKDTIEGSYCANESIKWYNKFWERVYKDSLSYSIREEPLYYLYDSYTELHQYEKAANEIKKALLLNTKYNGQTLSDADILSPAIFDLYKNEKFIFVKLGWFADCFLNKFKSQKGEKNLDALNKALQVYKLTDNLLFPGIVASDEDAVIIYQKEVAQNVYNGAIETAYELHKLTHKANYLNDALLFMERSKSFLLVRNSKTSKLTTNMPPQLLIDSVRNLISIGNQLKWQKEKGFNTPKTFVENDTKLNTLYSFIKKNYNDFYNSKVQQPISNIDQIKNTLKDKQAVIEYTMTKDHVYSLFISKENLDFNQNVWDSMANLNLEKYRYFLSENNGYRKPQEFIKTSTYLYEILLGHLSPKYLNINNLILIPDGVLSLIPFEPLIEPTINTPETNSFSNVPFIIKRLSISYTPAWKIYQNNPNFELPSKPKIMLFTYDNDSKELPYSEMEVVNIQNIFRSNATIFQGKNCNKSNFLNQHHNFDVIHLALHAYSSRNNKQDNKIWFMPNKKDTLYGFDIMNQNFNAKLVVLSACQTAYGKTETGEGTFSLSRAFMQAGIPHIIASLWKIDDNSTAEILPQFYKNISIGKSPPDALRFAKLEFINKSSFSANPKYWAGLVNFN
jgi:CHAT domain-containing protein